MLYPQSLTVVLSYCYNMVKVCIVRSCRNSNVYSMKKDSTFFRIPKDASRCKEWLINCNREDLCCKSLTVLHNVWVCNKHFNNYMFTSPEKNTLFPNALPTEFAESVVSYTQSPQTIQSSQTKQLLSVSTTRKQKLNVESNTDNEENISATETQDTTINTEHTSNYTFCELKSKNKKPRLSHPKNIVTELKGMTEAVNSSEEDEFEVFGRLVELQLKSMPLQLALKAQELIQLHLNRICRQHLQNLSEQN